MIVYNQVLAHLKATQPHKFQELLMKDQLDTHVESQCKEIFSLRKTWEESLIQQGTPETQARIEAHNYAIREILQLDTIPTDQQWEEMNRLFEESLEAETEEDPDQLIDLD